MTAPPMVERVARAIYEAGPLEPGPWNDDMNKWDRASPARKQASLTMARSAIEALREPSPTMIAEGRDFGITTTGHYAEDLWTAMIDAALRESDA